MTSTGSGPSRTCSASCGCSAYRSWSGSSSGPRPTPVAVVVLVVAGLTDWLDGYLARALEPALPDRPAARSGRRSALHPGHHRQPGHPRHHPVVAGDRARRPRRDDRGCWCRCCTPAATPRCRCTSWARRRPSACCTPSRWCCWVPADGHGGDWWPGSSAGRSRCGGPVCTGGPGSCTSARPSICCAARPQCPRSIGRSALRTRARCPGRASRPSPADVRQRDRA